MLSVAIVLLVSDDVEVNTCRFVVSPSRGIQPELLGIITMGWSSLLADWPRTGWSCKPDWQEKLSCPENSSFK